MDYASTPYQFSGGQIYDGKAKKVMLILPPPGTPGSLSANKDLVIGTDTVAPSNVTISINNGDASTDSRKVKLNLAAADNSGVTGYYLSEDQTTPSASAEGWFTLKPVTQFYGIEFTNLSSETWPVPIQKRYMSGSRMQKATSPTAPVIRSNTFRGPPIIRIRIRLLQNYSSPQ